ncbi:MAG: nucleoside hydrolase [Planctomycetia bacterium]|nr:nucleoside hydrolase [Planctomycetia bacterium]
MLRSLFFLTILWLTPTITQAQVKIPILLDFDIGEDIDDTFALALVLASPELDLRGVTTVGHDAYKRAQLTLRFLTAVGRKEVPVAAGIPIKQKPLDYWQVQYGNHASVYFRDPKPAKVPAAEFLAKKINDAPGELTLVAIGPLTNIAKLFSDHPETKAKIKRLVIMGGSVRRGYADGSKPQPEYNIVADVKAAQAVFRAGVPMTVAPLDATSMVALDVPRQKTLFDAGSLLTLSLQAMTQLWQEKNVPVLFDPVAIALIHTENFCTMEDLALGVDDQGFTVPVRLGKPNARVATAIKTDAFLDWYVERVASAMPKALPTMRVINESKLIDPGKMPNRVHVFEDFETDIEKRWWLSGRIETADTPPTSKRALRGVLTEDFDDLQGEMKTLYTAVVFNPVPSMPMGKNTRLRFKYRLQGTDTLRVQLYSLSNGYHRCLMLKDLPQTTWVDGCVDMTQMRKPDGTGGPLSEFERIDDIQFYVDPRAELLIDDIVLYDAGEADEKRAFPKRFLFTGLFDGGKQGKEWPGDFEIAQKQGYVWHAAKSIPHPTDKDKAWLRVNLRGDRPVGDVTHLSFRYKLEGASTINVRLESSDKKKSSTFSLDQKVLKQNDWASYQLILGPRDALVGGSVSDVTFTLPAAGRLWIDNLLLCEP